MTARCFPGWARQARQHGLSLVTAIFLLVVLSGLAGAIVNISISQASSSAQDVLGVRAYQAARAGIEWGLYQQLRNDSCVASTPVALPAGTTLSHFTVIVSCTRLGDANPNATGTSQLGVATTVSAGNKVLTVASTANLVEGMRVVLPGIIAPGTMIASIDSPTALTMTSQPLAGSAVPVAINFYSPLDQWELVSTACNLPTGPNCVNTSNSGDYVQRIMQVRF